MIWSVYFRSLLGVFLFILYICPFHFCALLSKLVPAECWALETNSTFASPEEHFLFAEKLFNEEFYDLAQEQYDLFAEQYPDHPKAFLAQYQAALALLRQNLAQAALKRFQNILEKSTEPSNKCKILNNIGISYLKLNEIEKAQEAFLKVKKDCQESSIIAAADFNLAKTYLYKKDYPKVLAILSNTVKSIDKKEDQAEAYFIMGKAALGLNDLDQTIANFKKALNFAENKELRADLLHQLGSAYFSKSDFDNALATYQQLIKEAPSANLAKLARWGMVWSYFQMQKYPEAYQIYQQLVPSSSEKMQTAVYQKAQEYLLLNQKMPALKYLKEFLTSQPEDPANIDLYLLLASIYEQFQMYPSATEQYKKAKSIAADEEAALKCQYLLGQTYLKQNNYVEAVHQLAEVAESISPYAEEADYQIGQIYFTCGDYEKALAAFQRHALFFPESSEIEQVLFKVAQCSAIQEHWSEAAKAYEKVASRHPESSLAQKATLEQCRSLWRAGNFAEAGQVLEKLTKSTNEEGILNETLQILYDLNSQIDKPQEFLKLAQRIEKSWDGKVLPSVKEPLTLLKAKALSQSDQNSEALELLQDLYQSASIPSVKLEAGLFIAKILSDSGKFAEANSTLTEIENLSQGISDQKNILWMQAFNNTQIGDCQTAAGKFSDYKALENLPLANDTATGLVQKCYLDHAELKEVLQQSADFAEYHPLNMVDAETRFRKGLQLFEEKQYEACRNSLEKLLHEAPNNAYADAANYYLAESWFNQNHFSASRAYYKHLISDYPQSSYTNQARLRLGDIFLRQLRYQEALTEYLKVDPQRISEADNISRLYHLGVCAAAIEDHEKALDFYRSMLEKNAPGALLPEELMQLGIYFQSQKSYDDSVKAFKMALAIADPSSALAAEIQYYIGETLALKEDYRQAIVEFLKVTLLHSGESEWMWAVTARYKAAQAYEELGLFKEALNLYSKIVQQYPDTTQGEYAAKRIQEIQEQKHVFQ